MDQAATYTEKVRFVDDLQDRTRPPNCPIHAALHTEPQVCIFMSEAPVTSCLTVSERFPRKGLKAAVTVEMSGFGYVVLVQVVDFVAWPICLVLVWIRASPCRKVPNSWLPLGPVSFLLGKEQMFESCVGGLDILDRKDVSACRAGLAKGFDFSVVDVGQYLVDELSG